MRIELLVSREAAEPLGLQLALGDEMGEPLASIVRSALDRWARTSDTPDHIEISEGMLVRVVAVDSLHGTAVGLHIEPFNALRTGMWARDFYDLSARESEVLALLIAGHSTATMAEKLMIAKSTIIDHISNLLQKTGSNSRTEMFARILGSTEVVA